MNTCKDCIYVDESNEYCTIEREWLRIDSETHYCSKMIHKELEEELRGLDELSPQFGIREYKSYMSQLQPLKSIKKLFGR